jgi:hypothetical protein
MRKTVSTGARPVKTQPMASRDPQRELERIFDDLSYELTGARTAGVDQPDELRAALRRARDLLADADGLAASIGAERSAGGDV